MAKFKLKKQSKRQPARLRYKIEKKVRQHNKSMRRQSKKDPKKKKTQVVQIPNICPFKEDILKEVELLKKQKEEERRKLREAAKQEKQKEKLSKGTLETLVSNAESRGKIHDVLTPNISNNDMLVTKGADNSLKAYYKEFKKVVEAADVVLEVVDARDPMGTRCTQVEQGVTEAQGNKRLVMVLNKADLIPRDILDKWLKHLKKSVPVIAFKASTQNQSKKLGQRKLAKTKNDKAIQGSNCYGAELLMSLLGNYCRNKDIKTSITVGIVGLPNVGKSSIINSLKRSRACNVGATPGVTKAMQVVQLDSKIKLLDSPGLVFAAGSDSSASLRNAVNVTKLADPITPANAILQRVGKKELMAMYNLSEYNTPDEFYSLKAARMGQFKKGGIPNTLAAARGLLEDWNSGKIKYYTVPPEEDSNSVHISAAIVSEIAKEFDLENLEIMETEVLRSIEKNAKPAKTTPLMLESMGPVDIEDEMDEDKEDDKDDELLSSNITGNVAKKVIRPNKQTKAAKKAKEPGSELEGNQQFNQVAKKQFKKDKKSRIRKEKVAMQLAEGLESFTITNKKDDNYDFDQDYKM